MNKKITLVFNYFHPIIGGVQLHMLEVFSKMAEMGWEVDAFVSRSDDHKKNVMSIPLETIRGIKVNRLESNYFFYGPWFVSRLKNDGRIIYINEFVILPNIVILLYFSFLKIFGLKKSKIVFASHGLFSNEVTGYSTTRKIKGFIDKYISLRIVSFAADKVVAISEYEKNALLKAGMKHEIETFKAGLDPMAWEDIDKNASDDVKKFVSASSPYIIQMGRIDRYKNYHVTIDALKLVDKINYVIVGPYFNPAYQEELHQQAVRLGLSDRVIFTGPKSGYDKYYLLKHSMAYVHMAKTEGFGIVVLEALSQGVPCIVSKNTGTSELVKDGVNGYTIEYNDIKSLSEKLKQIATQDNLRFSFRDENIKFAKTIKWENIANMYNSEFMELLS